jgi:hypothetical protein
MFQVVASMILLALESRQHCGDAKGQLDKNDGQVVLFPSCSRTTFANNSCFGSRFQNLKLNPEQLLLVEQLGSRTTNPVISPSNTNLTTQISNKYQVHSALTHRYVYSTATSITPTLEADHYHYHPGGIHLHPLSTTTITRHYTNYH